MEERNREEVAKLKQEMEVLKRGLESLQTTSTCDPQARGAGEALIHFVVPSNGIIILQHNRLT